MHEEIQNKISELRAALAKYAPKTAVSFQLFISDYETVSEFHEKTPEQLKANGISMKNLQGEFIK